MASGLCDKLSNMKIVEYAVSKRTAANSYDAFVFDSPTGYYLVGGAFTQSDGVDDLRWCAPMIRLDGKVLVRYYLDRGSNEDVVGTYKALFVKA